MTNSIPSSASEAGLRITTFSSQDYDQEVDCKLELDSPLKTPLKRQTSNEILNEKVNAFQQEWIPLCASFSEYGGSLDFQVQVMMHESSKPNTLSPTSEKAYLIDDLIKTTKAKSRFQFELNDFNKGFEWVATFTQSNKTRWSLFTKRNFSEKEAEIYHELSLIGTLKSQTYVITEKEKNALLDAIPPEGKETIIQAINKRLSTIKNKINVRKDDVICDVNGRRWMFFMKNGKYYLNASNKKPTPFEMPTPQSHIKALSLIELTDQEAHFIRSRYLFSFDT